MKQRTVQTLQVGSTNCVISQKAENARKRYQAERAARLGRGACQTPSFTRGVREITRGGMCRPAMPFAPFSIRVASVLGGWRDAAAPSDRTGKWAAVVIRFCPSMSGPLRPRSFLERAVGRPLLPCGSEQTIGGPPREKQTINCITT